MSNAQESIRPAAGQQNPKKLIRSQYKDIMVKVGEDIYHLDRLQLALKSVYFEKLFLDKDYEDRNLIELSSMDTDTFSAIVDVIYGTKIISVINADNFITMLTAMDYLQMYINALICTSIVNKQLYYWNESSNTRIFKLYHFIADHAKYKHLLPVVFHHLSKQLKNVQDCDELFSIKYDHLIQIILHSGKIIVGTEAVVFPSKLRLISEVCAKWICHDMNSRIRHAPDLVNAARFSLRLPNMVSCEDFNLQLSTNNERMNRDSISKYFFKWLLYCGEIRCSNTDASETFGNESFSTYFGYAPSYTSDSVTSEHEFKYEFEYRDYEPTASDCDDDYNYSFEDDYEFASDDDERRYKVLKERSFAVNRPPKLKKFLKNSEFYDITVKVGEKTYKLHRYVLKSHSLYFEEIFSKEYSEIAAQCEGIPTAPSKDKMYCIDEIDSATFDVIVDHMYLGKVKPNCNIIVPLFRAAHILKINALKTPCFTWIERNHEGISAKDVVQMLNLIRENPKYKQLKAQFSSMFVINLWPKVENLPECGKFFKSITIPEGTEIDTTSGKEVYLFDKVDRETFEGIINHIYLGGLHLTESNVVRVLKASDMFKIHELIEKCVEYLIRCRCRMSSADAREVLNFSTENIASCDILNTFYLVQHMIQWPQVDLELFCNISHDCLENMLLSNDLYFDNPRDLLDICSKWIIHDVENRYRLIARIALAISRNRVTDCDDYSIANPSSWQECSQDFVKNKIWEVLSSTSPLPFTLLSGDGAKQQKTEFPVFLASYKEKSFKIFNADWDEIASFRLCQNMQDPYIGTCPSYPMSATIINDNLFILCSMHECCFFHVYSLCSNKLFSLASDPRIFRGKDQYGKLLKYTLLNCRNEIYCCFEDGEVLKYSFEFNRWARFSAAVPGKYGITFTSDGDKLYRMYEAARTDTTTTCTVEVYDFLQNAWVSMPNVADLNVALNVPDRTLIPTRRRRHVIDEDGMTQELVFLKNYGLAALFQGCLFILDLETRIWRNIHGLPYEYVNVVQEMLVMHQSASKVLKHVIITQNETGEMLYVDVNKLYQFSPTDQSWVMKKEWPIQVQSVEMWLTDKILPYGNLIGIHHLNK